MSSIAKLKRFFKPPPAIPYSSDILLHTIITQDQAEILIKSMQQYEKDIIHEEMFSNCKIRY